MSPDEISKQKTRARAARSYQKNREKRLEARRAYVAANQEKVRESMRRTDAKRRDLHLVAMREYHAQNRDRRRQKMKEWAVANPERQRAYRIENAEAIREKKRAWHQANRERQLARAAEWVRTNRARYYSYKTQMRLARKRAVPQWADTAAITTFYAFAQRLTAETGVAHHVDHIVPLNGKTVCGLHVESNLRVIPGAENIRKKNRLIEELL